MTMLVRLAGEVVGVVLSVGVAHAAYDESVFYAKKPRVFRIPTPAPGAPPPVVGEVQLYRVRAGDTLMDLARLYGLGYNEIIEANPGVEPWVPVVGSTILLPTEWVLPCCTYEGVIVNVPEMRLYYMRSQGDGTTLVRTHPVGLGRDDWQTPSGAFKISGKTLNPRWVIPESIRQEHIAEKGDDRTFIEGGAPDNPLGKHRFELTLGIYRIHGTNIPWGVGMQVSHGCVRLYPEDIEGLFPEVPVGTSGAFVYDLVKVGRRGEDVYVELHDDIYGQTPALYSTAWEQIERLGVAGSVDQRALEDALRNQRHIPVRVSPGRDGARIDI